MSTVLRGKTWEGGNTELVMWLGGWEILCSGGRLQARVARRVSALIMTTQRVEIDGACL